jgi:mono/diheme cytochrome c family protein
MKKNLFGASVVIAALLGVALATQAAGAGDATAGKAVYRNKCMICHGADGEGATGYAKAMGLDPAQLSSDRVHKKTDAELKRIILEGSGKMKPLKGLSEIDLDNVIVYVRNFRKK